MPIAVTCPSCKAKFTVSDKFAGKQGPCPKCKAAITIPKAEAKPAESSVAKAAAPAAKGGSPTAKPGAPVKPGAPAKPGVAGAKEAAAAAPSKPAPAPMPEVVIHEPEAGGPKNASGRPTTKPLARRETRFELIPAVMISTAVLAALVASWVLHGPLKDSILIRAAGLLLLSPAIAVAGYAFLRDDELEPYRGRWLWIRASICGLVYLALWGAYLLAPTEMTAEAWGWIIVGPPFFLVGAGAAFATLDLDFGNAFFHYCFYLLLTLLLGAIAGLAMPWAGVA